MMGKEQRRRLMFETANAMSRWTGDLSEWRIMHHVTPAIELWFANRDSAQDAGRELAALGWEWTCSQSEHTGRWRVVATWKDER